MLYSLRFWVTAAATLLTAGCGTSDKTVSADPPSKTVKETLQTIKSPEAVTHVKAESIEAFLEQESVCREIRERRSLADFLKEFTTATKDDRQSRPNIKYAVYYESMYRYEFLDEKLFVIRFAVPRTSKSADDWMAPYEKAFGAPTTTQIPQDLQEAKATRFVSWNLPKYNLSVIFAHLPPTFAEADLDLFGQFVNAEAAKEYLARHERDATAKAPSASSKPKSANSSRDQIFNDAQTNRLLLTSDSTPEHLSSHPTICRSLRMAHELVATIEISDQRTATLWATVGKCYVDTGDFDSAKGILKSLDDKSQDKMVVLTKSVLAARTASGLAAKGRISEAVEVANRIPPAISDQRCTAFSGIAGTRHAAGDTENATKFWNLAIQAASAERIQARQLQNEVIVIRSLADHGRFQEALKLPLLSERAVDRSGWGPFAVGMAKSEKLEIAEQIVRLQMNGLNQDLLQFIERVAPDGNVAVCEAALSMMNDPTCVGLGRCLLASELIERGKREDARRLLATAFSELDAAKVGQDATGRFLVAALSPMTRLEGKYVGQDVCNKLEKGFAPELAAEAYRLFAVCRFPEEKSDAEKSLEKSEQTLVKVNEPLERVLLFRRVYQTRSSLFGEESCLNALKKVNDRVESCFAFVGVAEGLNLPKGR